MEEVKVIESKSIPLAQKEMRVAFLGGFAGQLVSGVIWLIAAGLTVFLEPYYGMIFLFFSSMSIFPLTQIILRKIGRTGKVSKENGLWGLGSQLAFTVPINFILVGGIILLHPEWFFPATMIIVGSHYLPFITLYGMKMFGVLSIILILSGSALAIFLPSIISLGGWLTGVYLIIFAFIGRYLVLKEEKS